MKTSRRDLSAAEQKVDAQGRLFTDVFGSGNEVARKTRCTEIKRTVRSTVKDVSIVMWCVVHGQFCPESSIISL